MLTYHCRAAPIHTFDVHECNHSASVSAVLWSPKHLEDNFCSFNCMARSIRYTIRWQQYAYFYSYSIWNFIEFSFTFQLKVSLVVIGRFCTERGAPPYQYDMCAENTCAIIWSVPILLALTVSLSYRLERESSLLFLIWIPFLTAATVLLYWEVPQIFSNRYPCSTKSSREELKFRGECRC